MTALTSSGYLRNYSLTMDQMLSQNEMHYDNSNHLNCADFTCDGRRLMIGGSDQKVHLYEESGERRYAGAISERGFKVPGHAGRVFSIKCHPDDPNVAVSCAWDSNLKIYDMRARKPVATIYGPRPFGDCLDLFDDMCISGNYRAKEALSMYSISMPGAEAPEDSSGDLALSPFAPVHPAKARTKAAAADGPGEIFE